MATSATPRRPTLAEEDYWLDQIGLLCGPREARAWEGPGSPKGNRQRWQKAIRDHWAEFYEAYCYTKNSRDSGRIRSSPAKCLNSVFERLVSGQPAPWLRHKAPGGTPA